MKLLLTLITVLLFSTSWACDGFVELYDQDIELFNAGTGGTNVYVAVLDDDTTEDMAHNCLAAIKEAIGISVCGSPEYYERLEREFYEKAIVVEEALTCFFPSFDGNFHAILEATSRLSWTVMYSHPD